MGRHGQAALKFLIKEEFRSLSAFAKQCGVSQSLVWRDCQDRVMSDSRCGKYLKILSPQGRVRLIQARLRDLLPEGFEFLVTISACPNREKSSNLNRLSDETQKDLEQLADEMVKDPELEDWVRKFIRKVC